MEKEFVPYELALRMKTLGFNENCYRVGNPNGAICWRFMDVAGVEGVGIDDILLEKFDKLWWVEIPTFSQAFRWFRERDFHTTIESYHCLGNDRPFGLGIDQKINGIWDYVDYSGDGNFDTYEEAQIKAIESILEIMEKKIP